MQELILFIHLTVLSILFTAHLLHLLLLIMPDRRNHDL